MAPSIEDLKPKKATQRAQQFDPRDNKLHLNEIPIPTPKPNELLVKIACASLCHSDVMLLQPNEAGLVLGDGQPITMGHEGTGFVVEAGADAASQFKAGDAVGFLPAIDCCFECVPCKETHNLHCTNGKVRMQGFAADGFFQEYVCVDYRGAMVLPDGMDPYTSSALFCAGVTAFHGVVDCELKEGQWMAIIGTGGLGHLGIAYAKKLGIKVIGLDIAEGALEEAKAQGADHVFNTMTDKDYVKKIQEITDGGVMAAVNFTASKRSYDAAYDIMKPAVGAVLMVVGIPQQPLEFPAMFIAMRRFVVKGSNNGTGYNMRPAIEFSAKHNIQPHTTFYQLEQLPEMIDLMQSHKARGRMAVQFK